MQVSENLIGSVAPHLAPPVAREPIRSASDTGDGARLAIGGQYFGTGGYYQIFADDDAE